MAHDRRSSARRRAASCFTTLALALPFCTAAGIAHGNPFEELNNALKKIQQGAQPQTEDQQAQQEAEEAQRQQALQQLQQQTLQQQAQQGQTTTVPPDQTGVAAGQPGLFEDVVVDRPIDQLLVSGDYKGIADSSEETIHEEYEKQRQKAIEAREKAEQKKKRSSRRNKDAVEEEAPLEPVPPPIGEGQFVFSPKHMLEHLDAAEAWRMQGDDKRAIQHYDAVESALSAIETQSGMEQGARQALAVLVNDNSLSYTPSPSESVLANYYKAISFWKMGDLENTRVEFNRADDRIRRATERYEAEIAAAQKKNEEDLKENPLAAELSSNPLIAEGVDTRFSEIKDWSPYETYVFPPTIYAQAVFLGRNDDKADREKAADSMKRVKDITGTDVARDDIADLKQGRLCPKDDCVWILSEHGLGPKTVERRFDLPIPTEDGMIVLSMALPALTSRTASGVAPFSFTPNAGREVTLSEIADMDRLIQTEFKKRWPGVLARATISALIKGIIQSKMNQETDSMFGNILTSAMTAGLTQADIRSWDMVPGRFNAARIKRGKAKNIKVSYPGGESVVNLPDKGAAFVYVKQLAPGTPPIVTVMGV